MSTKLGPCDLWDGYITGSGYGQTGRNTLVHKKVWEEAHGPVPDGHHVHHRCEVKACRRLSHLELLPNGEHTFVHRASPVCPRCGGTNRVQVYTKGGRKNGRKCLDCDGPTGAKLGRPKTVAHGMRSMYVYGCRCDECKAAARAYDRERRQRDRTS